MKEAEECLAVTEEWRIHMRAGAKQRFIDVPGRHILGQRRQCQVEQGQLGSRTEMPNVPKLANIFHGMAHIATIKYWFKFVRSA